MGAATVILLPGGDPVARARLHLLVDPPDRSWQVLEVPAAGSPAANRSAHACAAIAAAAPAAPLVVAAAGDAALLLPAVARAQLAAHRRVEEYLLVRPDLPPVTDSWPDAPVTVVVDDAADLVAATVRLRGWTLLVGADPWRPAD